MLYAMGCNACPDGMNVKKKNVKFLDGEKTQIELCCKWDKREKEKRKKMMKR